MRESKYHQWYDSLQLQFQRRYRAGLMFTTHYTWANGEWDSWAPWDISITERFPNPLLIQHRFVVTAAYELPARTSADRRVRCSAAGKPTSGRSCRADCRTTSQRGVTHQYRGTDRRTWCVIRTSRRISGR
jgi:hypothetical protein